MDTPSLAERVGFEPTVGCPITSFQDWLLKPLGHLSMWGKLYHLQSQKSSKKRLFFSLFLKVYVFTLDKATLVC